MTHRVVGIVLKPGLTLENPNVAALMVSLHAAGFEICIDQSACGTVIGQTWWLECAATYMTIEQQLAHCEFIISIGGDGTMLGLMREAAKHESGAFLVGVNMGTVGFITDVELNGAADVLIEMIRDDKYMYESRSTIYIDAADIGFEIAANDILLQRAGGRLLDFRVEFDGRFAYDCRADGLLISTPTGSTAYSLAAGGPIIEPTADVLLITPLLPQNLSSRPIIVNSDVEIRVTLTGPENAKLYIDGIEAESPWREFTIKAGPEVNFAYHAKEDGDGRDFTKALRNKLGWNHRV